MFLDLPRGFELRWAVVDIARGRGERGGGGGGGTERRVSPVCFSVRSDRNNDSVLGRVSDVSPSLPDKGDRGTAGGGGGGGG